MNVIFTSKLYFSSVWLLFWSGFILQTDTILFLNAFADCRNNKFNYQHYRHDVQKPNACWWCCVCFQTLFLQRLSWSTEHLLTVKLFNYSIPKNSPKRSFKWLLMFIRKNIFRLQLPINQLFVHKMQFHIIFRKVLYSWSDGQIVSIDGCDYFM